MDWEGWEFGTPLIRRLKNTISFFGKMLISRHNGLVLPFRVTKLNISLGTINYVGLCGMKLGRNLVKDHQVDIY